MNYNKYTFKQIVLYIINKKGDKRKVSEKKKVDDMSFFHKFNSFQNRNT